MTKRRQASREIGQRIRQARKLSGLNQQEVEAEIGKSKNAVSRWERAEVQLDATDPGEACSAVHGVGRLASGDR